MLEWIKVLKTKTVVYAVATATVILASRWWGVELDKEQTIQFIMELLTALATLGTIVGARDAMRKNGKVGREV